MGYPRGVALKSDLSCLEILEHARICVYVFICVTWSALIVFCIELVAQNKLCFIQFCEIGDMVIIHKRTSLKLFSCYIFATCWNPVPKSEDFILFSSKSADYRPFFPTTILCKSCNTIFWSPSDQNSPQKNDKVLGNFDTNYSYLSKMLKFSKT
jgi:hypothetical protein